VSTFKVGDKVRYIDFYPQSRYSDFLGTGIIRKLSDPKILSQRPVIVEFSECEDKVNRKRSFSLARLKLVCSHERLNEEGICRQCGADRRGI
jgi:hypothetical protein